MAKLALALIDALTGLASRLSLHKPTGPAPSKDKVTDTPPEATRVEAILGLLTYHYGAMQARRSLSFKVFLAATGFDLILLKGIFDERSNVVDFASLKVPIILFYWLLAIVYAYFTIKIERVNTFNRRSYIALEREALSVATQKPVEPSPPETKMKAIGRAWGTCSTIAAKTLITTFCTAAIWRIKTGP